MVCIFVSESKSPKSRQLSLSLDQEGEEDNYVTRSRDFGGHAPSGDWVVVNPG